ncbi:response regulator [Cereibacter sphaeroides]|uniref:response regulator n=1 Tax=Cereibacter sphaeroides TaxID=1063 RepID=UPI001F2AF6CD|nr:response regulator [Cereibacter sphaeroides]MCE6950694.1 response regulator [Cereibacter sphaeroides]MCE6959079.1 response regulator [Cereibacter sphaeroides]MCE6968320.1 response regulator [Cereibacter sphaeroides]MCE6974260.1 response regulator [Cereibacter sphaeroides]
MTSAPTPQRVLVVEDDDSIAAALEYVVLHEGLRHERVANGAVALRHIRETRPDLVLLDVMLPELSGYEICHEVRLDPSLRNIKIVMMTARGSALERKRGMSLGADGFVSKPFELGDLRHEVRRLLAGGRSAP